MPRRRRTQSGAPAQKMGSVPGQRYGEGVAQQEMQAQLPAPDNRVMAARPSAPAAGPPVEQQEPAAPMMSLQDIIQRASMAGMEGGGMLGMPTQRPDEPITAGLSSGPGPGPEALGPALSVSTQGRFLRELSQRTGNPYFARLADRSGL